MVAVGKNTQIVKNLEFSINGKSSENLDDLFAELFALVNLENSPENNLNIEKSLPKSDELQIDKKAKNPIHSEINTEKNNENELLFAKTLVEIFYDEMGLNQSKAENSSNKLVSNDLSIKKDSKKSDKLNIFNEKLVNNNLKKSNDINTKDLKLVSESLENKFNKINIEIRVEKKKDSLESQNLKKKVEKVPFISFEKSKENLQNPSKTSTKENSLENRTNKININNNLSEKKKTKKQVQENSQLKGNQNELSQKKISIEPNFSGSKNILVKTHQKNNISSEISKEKSTKTSDFIGMRKNSLPTSNFNNQDTLDLLESSWGEKFTKILKNSINNNIEKINLKLNPKNLGKISLEISVKKDNSPKIIINADTQEAANILNENISKLEEMVSDKDSKFSGFGNSNNDNFFRNQKRKNDDELKKVISSKKNNVSEKSNNKNIHNIDVKA